MGLAEPVYTRDNLFLNIRVLGVTSSGILSDRHASRTLFAFRHSICGCRTALVCSAVVVRESACRAVATPWSPGMTGAICTRFGVGLRGEYQPALSGEASAQPIDSMTAGGAFGAGALALPIRKMVTPSLPKYREFCETSGRAILRRPPGDAYGHSHAFRGMLYTARL